MQHQHDKDLRVEVAETIDEIPKESLEDLGEYIRYTYGWLKTLELARSHFKMKPRYLVVYEKREIVAFMPTYIRNDFRYFTLENKSSLIKRIVAMGNHIGIHVDRGRVLVCNPPECSHSMILVKKGYNTKTILSLLSGKIDEICRQEKILASSFTAVSEFGKLLSSNLQEFGYFNVFTTNSMYLDVPWSNFDEYLNGFRHNMRRCIKKEITRFEESGLIVEEEKNFGRYADTLSNLYSQLYSKYKGGKECPFDPDFFRNLEKYAKAETRVFLAKRNGKILGFSLGFNVQNVYDAFMCGFDYTSLTRTDYVYFNLTYYHRVKLAIDEHIERLYYSIFADTSKLRRGCEIEKLYSFIKIHNRILRPLAGLYLRNR